MHNILSYRDCLLLNLPDNSQSIINLSQKNTICNNIDLYNIHHNNINHNINDNLYNNIDNITQLNTYDVNIINDDNSDDDEEIIINMSRLLEPKLEHSNYKLLDRELNKIRALSSFKNNLVEHIIRYFRSHKFYNHSKLKYIRTQMYNHFPNWFFNLNMIGQIIDFLPQSSFNIQDNLDYIFNENNIQKRKNFDSKLLTFNPNYINDDLQTIQIIKKEFNNVIRYHLITNGGIWKLLPITSLQLDNIKKRYIGSSDHFDEYLVIMLLRYKFLGGLNNHLSIPPIIYKYLNITTELFGSPFNVITTEYCSPFPDVEHLFGSSGSFMNYHLKDNQIYAINPPYDVHVIKLLADKLNSDLHHLQNVTIYITIPLWKDDFPAYNILKSNIYLKDECELKRELFPFYHYFKNRFIQISNTYLLVLSTSSNYFTCDQIKKKWLLISQK